MTAGDEKKPYAAFASGELTSKDDRFVLARYANAVREAKSRPQLAAVLLRYPVLARDASRAMLNPEWSWDTFRQIALEIELAEQTKTVPPEYGPELVALYGPVFGPAAMGVLRIIASREKASVGRTYNALGKAFGGDPSGWPHLRGNIAIVPLHDKEIEALGAIASEAAS